MRLAALFVSMLPLLAQAGFTDQDWDSINQYSTSGKFKFWKHDNLIDDKANRREADSIMTSCFGMNHTDDVVGKVMMQILLEKDYTARNTQYTFILHLSDALKAKSDEKIASSIYFDGKKMEKDYFVERFRNIDKKGIAYAVGVKRPLHPGESPIGVTDFISHFKKGLEIEGQAYIGGKNVVYSCSLKGFSKALERAELKEL